MPSQRKAGKKLIGFFANEEENAAIIAAAREQGLSVADWIRSLIPPSPPPTLVNSAGELVKSTAHRQPPLLVDLEGKQVKLPKKRAAR